MEPDPEEAREKQEMLEKIAVYDQHIARMEAHKRELDQQMAEEIATRFNGLWGIAVDATAPW